MPSFQGYAYNLEHFSSPDKFVSQYAQKQFDALSHQNDESRLGIELSLWQVAFVSPPTTSFAPYGFYCPSRISFPADQH